MVVVSNTSPISNLALIDRLDLLRIQFHQVLIPDAVKRELDRLPDQIARARVDRCIEDGWLCSRAVQDTRRVEALTKELDLGEAEAIALATGIGADILLIDEKDGRIFARQARLNVRGVLGILIRAKEMGNLEALKPEIDSLRSKANFFVSPILEAEVLKSVGE